MSKRVDEREDTELKALSLVEKLATHTFVKCKSFKCPKRERWLFPDRMRQHALDAVTCTAAANGTFIGPGPNLEVNYDERHRQQVRARGHIQSLLALVKLALNIGHLNAREAEYWTMLAAEALAYNKKWAESDTGRYRRLSQ